MSGYDRCDGGRLFSDRAATELLVYRLRAALGRAVRGPAGQSPEGPGAGPHATGREEVLLAAQAEQLTVWASNR